MSEVLRQFSEIHIGEDCRNVGGHHENGLFHGCSFNKLNGLTLKDCVLNRSEFLADSIRDALGFTVTLDCNSFHGVTLSPLVFDLILSLLVSTTGNDSKREQLKLVVGEDRMNAILRIMKVTE